MMLRHYNGGDLKAHCDTAVQVIKILCERSCENNIVTDRRLIESLLVILKTCGDYELQNNVVCSLLQLPQVQQFQDWFAPAWFSSDDTVAIFQELSEPRRDAEKHTKNIRTFLNCFNKNESGDSLLVQSIRCESASWDSCALLPADQEGDLWLDFNPGTKCLTICVKELPSWFERHVTIPKNATSVCLELPKEFLVDAIVAQCPLAETQRGSELTIHTKRGTLKVGVSDQEVNWSYVNKAWKYITTRDLVHLSLSNHTCVDQENALETSLSPDVTHALAEFFKSFSVEDCES